MTEVIEDDRSGPSPIRVAADLRWEDPTRSWDSIAKEIGIGVATLYRWRQTEEWKLVFQRAGREALEPLAPTALMALRKQWNRGNAGGALDILRDYGILGSERIEIDRIPTDEEIIALRDRLLDKPE